MVKELIQMLELEKKDVLINYFKRLNFCIFFIYFLNFFKVYAKKNTFLSKVDFNIFNYKHYKILKMCKIFFQRNKTYSIQFVNEILYFLNFYRLTFSVNYFFFFKVFFVKFKNYFYNKTYNNRLLFNLSYFKIEFNSILKNFPIDQFFNTLFIKKKIYTKIFLNPLSITKKRPWSPKYFPWQNWVLQKIKMKKLNFFLEDFLSNNSFILNKLVSKLMISRNYTKKFKRKKCLKRKLHVNLFYLNTMQYYSKWSIFSKKKFNLKIRYAYNLLFLRIFLKIKKSNKKKINFFKYFLIAKDYFKNKYKLKFYYCFLKKKKNNSFLTLVNNFGEVVFWFSAGRLNLPTKKYTRSYAAIKLFWPILAKRIKLLSINKIIFMINMKSHLNYYKIKKLFRRTFIKFQFRYYLSKPHNNILKSKKLKRVKRK